MQSARSIIEHIAVFTSQKDLDLLSRSLLKSLTTLLEPVDVSMVRLNDELEALQQICLVNGAYKTLHDHIVIQSEAMAAIESLKASEDKQTNVPLDNGERLYVYLMSQNRRALSFLLIRMHKPLSESEAFLMSGTLEIFNNFSELIRYSQTDELTGLANRKTFESAIGKVYDLLPTDDDFDADQEKRAEVPKDRGYWLAILDIDHFKRINDEFGHLYGDEVLVKLAQLLTDCFREHDMVFRFGGEEFVIILRCSDMSGCAVALERFRACVAEEKFPGVGKVTISGGVVEIDRGTFHVSLLDYADKALYSSKESGRDRITFFEDMVAAGEASYEVIHEGEIELF